MKLVRWSPLEEINFLQSQIDSIFKPLSDHEEGVGVNSHTLPVEVIETPKAYHVRVMVPGIPADKIQLQCTPRSLNISTEMKPKELRTDETVHLKQFHYGKFTKQLSLPEAVSPDDVEARYDLGILEITLPKAENIQSKTIQISTQS